MRCASKTAASRCTCTRCCRSSMVLMRSANWLLSDDSGSRDSGAPALAASRCQAMASAMLTRGAASNASALPAHSAAMASWAWARRISSSRSRTARAAPLSRALNSLKTSCRRSAGGLLVSHSRMRAARSPEVAAEKAPPVRESSGCGSLALPCGAGVSGTSDMLLREEKGNMVLAGDEGSTLPFNRQNAGVLEKKRTGQAACCPLLMGCYFGPVLLADR